MPPVTAGAAWIWLATFGFSLAGGIVPALSIEAYVLAVSAASPHADVLPVAVAAALGQMVAKCLVYLAGTGLLRLPFVGRSRRVESAVARLARGEGRALAMVLASAMTSVPPFYAVSLAAGTLRVRFAGLFAAGCLGGFVRFAALFAVPRLLG
jgi:membrane protein YqaA with SNARE-associated domain